jgi:putative transposase
MCRYLGLWLGLLLRCVQSRRSLLPENLALRQQLVVLKRKHPRPRIGAVDKIFWLLARRFWSTWKQSLVLVNPETVVRCHRAGFRLYWSLISGARGPWGRKKLSKEIWDLIFQMVAENPSWGAPRIHGELLHAGVRGFGANHLSLDEAGAPRSWASQMLAYVS